MSLTRAKSVPNCQLGLMLIALDLPGGDLRAQGADIGHPAIQALSRQDREFIFGPIEPTAVLRRFLWNRPVCQGSVCQARLDIGPTAFKINRLAL